MPTISSLWHCFHLKKKPKWNKKKKYVLFAYIWRLQIDLNFYLISITQCKASHSYIWTMSVSYIIKFINEITILIFNHSFENTPFFFLSVFLSFFLCKCVYIWMWCEWRTFPLSFPFLLQSYIQEKPISKFITWWIIVTSMLKKKKRKKFADSSLSDAFNAQQWMEQQKAKTKFVSLRSLTFCMCAYVFVYVFGPSFSVRKLLFYCQWFLLVINWCMCKNYWEESSHINKSIIEPAQQQQ